MLVLVRHGQTDANARGLLLGRADPPLSPLGRRQAAALADRVPTAARVISSPLARCCETAAAFDRPVTVDERWIELDYGEYDGRPVGDVPADVWQTWRADPHYVPPATKRRPAEPLSSLRKDHEAWSCGLRYHGEWGVEAQLQARRAGDWTRVRHAGTRGAVGR